MFTLKIILIEVQPMGCLGRLFRLVAQAIIWSIASRIMTRFLRRR